MKKSLLIDARWGGAHGIGRFGQEVISKLETQYWSCEKITEGVPLLHPIEPVWLSSKIWTKCPDVYFSPGFNPPLACRCPLLFTIHDLIHLDYREESSPTKRLFYSSIVRPAARRAFTVFTNSNYSKEKIVDWAHIESSRVKVVGSGVDDKFFHEQNKYSFGCPYLLYVGNRKPHKNLNRLISSFAQSKVSNDFHLLISGNADDQLLAEAKRLHVYNKVSFTGFIPDADLPRYYRGAHAFVFPSLHEGFGLPAVEAMATGTPLLTSNATCLPEIVGNAALTVDAQSIDALEDGLDRICYDTALRSRLNQAGPERARRYSWDKTAQFIRESISQAMDVDFI